MTEFGALQELFKINLDELNIVFGLELSIIFTNDNFIVDNGSEVIFMDNILNYDLDFESQKKFILNVASKVFKFVRDEKDMEYKFIDVNNKKDLYKVVGYNKFMYKKYSIKVDTLMFEKYNNINNDEEYEKCLTDVFRNLISKLDWNKIDVVYDLENDCFYVNVIIRKITLIVYSIYKYETEYFSYMNSVVKLSTMDTMNIYYSDIDDEEAINAINLIKDLLYPPRKIRNKLHIPKYEIKDGNVIFYFSSKEEADMAKKYIENLLKGVKDDKS